MNAGVALRQMNVSTICVGQPSTKLDKQIFLDDCGEETTVLVSHWNKDHGDTRWIAVDAVNSSCGYLHVAVESVGGGK